MASIMALRREKGAGEKGKTRRKRRKRSRGEREKGEGGEGKKVGFLFFLLSRGKSSEDHFFWGRVGGWGALPAHQPL